MRRSSVSVSTPVRAYGKHVHDPSRFAGAARAIRLLARATWRLTHGKPGTLIATVFALVPPPTTMSVLPSVPPKARFVPPGKLPTLAPAALEIDPPDE